MDFDTKTGWALVAVIAGLLVICAMALIHVALPMGLL